MSQRSVQSHAAELLQAVHTYSPRAFYQLATVENAPCAESDRPACVRMQPRPRVPVVAAPTTNLFHDSNGSARPACVDRDLPPPLPSPGDSRGHFSGRASGTPPIRFVSAR